MKTVKIGALSLALSGIVVAHSAVAQSTEAQAWQGFYADAKVGYASFSPSVGSGSLAFPNAAFRGVGAYPVSGSYSASASTLNTATGAIAAGYNFAVDSNKLLGLNLTYYTGATGSGNGTLSPTANLPALYGGATPGPQVNLNYQLKNLWAITLQPGFAIDKDRLVYAKVGYTGVTIGASGSSAAATLPAGGAGSTVAYQTVNLSGYALGLGYKQIISGSLYWLAEANYGSFSNKTATLSINNATLGGAGTATGTFGGSGMDFLVGVGYRF